MIGPPSIDDVQKAQAVLHLAKSLFEYGQHKRVLSLLDLHDWLAPKNPEACVLRINSLLKLDQFDRALSAYRGWDSDLSEHQIAELDWRFAQLSLTQET